MSNSRLPKAPEHAIQTCADTLLHPGACCWDGCGVRATLAVLDERLVEHTRCQQHAGPDPALTKPLLWDPTWEPPGKHEHQFSRVIDGQLETASLVVQPSGVVIASEAAMVALMADAGWERLS